MGDVDESGDEEVDVEVEEDSGNNNSSDANYDESNS